jgi:hypothetical protein
MSGNARGGYLVGALLVAACGTPTQPGVGGLSGTNTLAVVKVGGFYDGGVVDNFYGQLAFVTSTNANVLKAINLYVAVSGQFRDWVGAPNPLEPLAIPVVNQPVDLTPAVRYGPISTASPNFPAGVIDGQQLTGSLLFVRGAGSPFISVVNGANVPEGLRQLTNGLLLQGAGPVTALSARLTSNEQNVVLYYATFNGQDATVWERVLQHPATREPSFGGTFPTSLTPVADCSLAQPPPLPQSATPTTLYLCPPRPVRTFQNAQVSALLVLPTRADDTPLPVLVGPSGWPASGLEGGRLAVAIRELVPPLNSATLSNAGQVRIIDPALSADVDTAATSTDPLFRLVRFFPPFDVEPPVNPNAPPQPPIRQLFTHGRAYISDDGGVAILAYEGQRLFGIVDESSCYGAVECTGILAADASPVLVDGGPNENYGLLAFDNSDCPPTSPVLQNCAVGTENTNRMLALRLGIGLIQGAAIESNVPFPSIVGLVQVPLLGTATVSGIGDRSGAQIFFFDGLGLRWLNESQPPGVFDGGVTLATLGGFASAVPDSFITATPGVGLYPQPEAILIINNGTIPGLGIIPALPRPNGGGLAWPVPDGGLTAARAAVQVNDQLYPVNLSGTSCTFSLDGGPAYPYFLPVTGVDDGGTSIFTGPLVTEDILLRCGSEAYTVLAGPDSAQPFLVEGGVSGLLGRATLNGEVFQVPNAISVAFGLTYPRFFNPPVDPGTRIVEDEIFPPDDAGFRVLPLTLQISPNLDPVFLANSGANYTFILSAGFLRASMPIDAATLGFTGLYLPGGVATTRVRDVFGETVLVLVAYPSANAVIDFIPDEVVPNTPNSGAILVHY